MSQPKASIIIFDLHEVLVKKDYIKVFFCLVSKVYRLDILFILLKPSSLRIIKKLWETSRVPEQYLQELADQHPSLYRFVPYIVHILNQQKPILAVLDVVRELKIQDYKLYLFSNIGQETYKDFQKKYHHITRLFDDIIFTQPQDGWIQKPHPAAYKKFLIYTNKKAHECLFIDNNKKNIESAHNHGFNTILYISPDQVRNELEVAGYLKRR